MNNASSRSPGRDRRFRERHRLLTIGRHPGLSLCSHVRAGEQRRPWWARFGGGAPTLPPPAPATRVPAPGSVEASVQPCTRFGTGHGWWVWLRHARRPQAPLRGHRTVGDHGAGGVTVTARVCSGFASMAEVGARCPTFLEQARSWPCSFRRRLAERLRPIGEETRRPLAATRGRERSRALFVGGRHSSSARSRSPFTRQARKGGVGLGGGCRRKASHRRDTRSARGSLGTRPSGRERRSGGRSAGRSG